MERLKHSVETRTPPDAERGKNGPEAGLFNLGFRKIAGEFAWGGDGRAEWGETAGFEAIDPAVDADFLAPGPGVLDDGGAGDVAGLSDDVEFAEAVDGAFGG